MISWNAYRACIRAVACACALFSFDAYAQISVLESGESEPGVVTVRVQSDRSIRPDPSEFALKLSGPEPRIPAGRINEVSVEANQTALFICLDRSGSMGHENVNAVVRALKQALVPAAGPARLPINVTMVTFATTVERVTKGFTSDPREIGAALAKVRMDTSRQGKTLLNDAIGSAITELRSNPAQFRKLLVISDGGDEGSDIHETELIRQASNFSGFSVEAVALGRLAETRGESLGKLAFATGGNTYRPRDDAELAQQIEQLVRQFVTGRQFEVSFRFDPAPDGQKAQSPQLLYGGDAQPLRANITARAVRAPPPPPNKGLNIILILKVVIGVTLTLGISVVIVRKHVLLVVQRQMHHLVVWFKRDKTTKPPTTGGGNGTKRENAVRNVTRVGHQWPLPAGGRPVAVLEAKSGVARGRRWTIDQAKFNVGSAADNDLVLEHDDFVSGHHAILKAEEHGLRVTDLGSRNGTSVNGQIIRSATRALVPGDEISVGNCVFSVLTAVAEKPMAGAARRA